MAHVLIGFAEALPAPEVVFSLRAAGHRISAFARTDALPLARLPVDLHVLPAPEVDSIAAKAALCDLIARIGADVVLPLDDAGLWLVHASDTGMARVTGPDAAQVALDKVAQIAAAKAAELDVPPTVHWDGKPGAVPDITWPAIAKPGLALVEASNRLAKGDAVYLDGPETDFFAEDRTAGAPWLIQPLIAGQGEGVFGFVTGDGAVAAWSGHRRLRMMNPHGSGASACESTMPDVSLNDRIVVFLTAIGWRGPFMVELLRDANGTPWFMELNGRMWGSMALARRQGFEYPAWAAAQALDPDFVPDAPAPRQVSVRHLGRELLHLAFVARGPKSGFHRTGWPRLRASLAAVLRPGRGHGFYNHDPEHPRYFLRDAAWTLRKALRR